MTKANLRRLVKFVGDDEIDAEVEEKLHTIARTTEALRPQS